MTVELSVEIGSRTGWGGWTVLRVFFTMLFSLFTFRNTNGDYDGDGLLTSGETGHGCSKRKQIDVIYLRNLVQVVFT